jgi:hypothetical protein
MKATRLAWRAMRRNTLLGFAKIQLGALIINDVSINTSNGKTWANLPSKPMVDRDGAAMRSADGKIRYVPLLEWSSKESGDRFSEAVIAAVEEKEPGALAG